MRNSTLSARRGALEQVRRVLAAKARSDRLARFDLVGVLHRPLALDEEGVMEECRAGYFVTTGLAGPPDHRNHRVPWPPPVISARFFARADSA